MKKLTALLLTTAMTLSLTACGAGSGEAASKDAAAQENQNDAAKDENPGTAETAETADADEQTAESTDESGFVPALAGDTAGTLNFVGSWGNFEALDQVALDFQQYYPDVEVVYTKLDDYRNDLANRFATGEEIDLFMGDWWDVEYPLNQNIIDNAADLSAAGLDLSSLEEDLLSAGAVDGAQLVVPIYQQSFGYMVNLDLFEAAGAEIPTTYTELQETCEKLSAAGYDKPIYINSSLFGRTFTGYYMEQKQAGGEDVAALDNTIAKMDELFASGYVNDEGDTLEDSYNAMILRFFEGDIPLQSISLNNYSGTAKREAKSEAFTAQPFRYTYIPAPYGEENRAYINQLGTIYVGIYKNSNQQELADEFLRFMLTENEMSTLSSIKNMPTANGSAGLENFPYLQNAEKFYNTGEGLSSIDEERILNVLSIYRGGADHTDMYDKMNDYIENGLR